MTDVLPQAELGAVTAVPAISGLSKFNIISDEARRVKSLDPVQTVWGRSTGRPIYDRLPGVSEQYRIDYWGDAKIGLVLIDPGVGGLTGPGSMEVGYLADNHSLLIIQSGVITWAYGQIKTTGLAVDLRSLVAGGVQDGVYRVGYYLDYTAEPAEQYSLFDVDDYSLSATASIYAASSEATQHGLHFVFSDVDDGNWRPTAPDDASNYDSGASITIDFTEPVISKKFLISGTAEAGVRCALYTSDDAVVWTLADQAYFDNGWELSITSLAPSRYKKFFFWNGEIEVTGVRYSGQALFQNQRPSGPVSQAEPFIDDEVEEANRPHITLAEIEVRNQKVASVVDLRKTTKTPYEPVAKWLTDAQDSSLRSLVTDVAEYAPRYMSPPSACADMYSGLYQTGFVLAPEIERPEIVFPGYISLKSGWYVPDQGGGSAYTSDSSVMPKGIIRLGDPLEQGDVSTKEYTDLALIPLFDNGQY